MYLKNILYYRFFEIFIFKFLNYVVIKIIMFLFLGILFIWID